MQNILTCRKDANLNTSILSDLIVYNYGGEHNMQTKLSATAAIFFPYSSVIIIIGRWFDPSIYMNTISNWPLTIWYNNGSNIYKKDDNK